MYGKAEKTDVREHLESLLKQLYEMEIETDNIDQTFNLKIRKGDRDLMPITSLGSNVCWFNISIRRRDESRKEIKKARCSFKFLPDTRDVVLSIRNVFEKIMGSLKDETDYDVFLHAKYPKPLVSPY